MIVAAVAMVPRHSCHSAQYEHTEAAVGVGHYTGSGSATGCSLHSA